MSKSQLLNLEISAIATLFEKPYDFTEAMILLHEISLPLPRFRQAFDGLDAFYSDMTGYYNTDPSLTKQEFTDACDPNSVMDRVSRGQDISVALSAREPRYGDFTNSPASYHEALNLVTAANQSFLQLDPKLRARFDNDPAKLLEFMSNPDNAEQLVELGLAEAKPAEVTSPAATPSPVAAKEGGGEGA